MGNSVMPEGSVIPLQRAAATNVSGRIDPRPKDVLETISHAHNPAAPLDADVFA